MLHTARAARAELRLSTLARQVRESDHLYGLSPQDPGPGRVIREGLAWLARAQDGSSTADGGVARHFSLLDGWGPSYPETTGYIVPTFLDRAARTGDPRPARRARRMLDWLVSLQMPDGAFPGGTVGQQPVVPVTFNTGQILIGLASGAAVFGEPYRTAMRRAADWLVETQDPDGAWRLHPTPFAKPGEKAYETHVAWGLFEAARLERDAPYAAAALANVRWALGRQLPNGWFADCCLDEPDRPLTHTLGYVLRGLVEAFRFTGDPKLLEAALRTADGLLAATHPGGLLPGRLGPDWQGTAEWVCLTGTAQVACCWLLLHAETGEPRFLQAAREANHFVRRTVWTSEPSGLRGGVKGSFPVDGGYAPYQLLNWATKFVVDANQLELAAERGAAPALFPGADRRQPA